MSSILDIWRVVSAHPWNLRTRLRVIFRALSQWLVLRPNDFCLIGEVPEALLPALLSRFEWFYGSIANGSIAIRRKSGWETYPILKGKLGSPRRSGTLRAIGAGLLGKILVHEYTPFWLKLDTLLNHKVFVVNWTREYRVSSWRFAASVAKQPLRRFGSSFAKIDERCRSNDVVVLGNGPSAYNVFDQQFEGMDVIVCNTAIKSQKLLRERNVVAVGFIDATFFVGPSAYTKAFFKTLDSALKSKDLSVYVDYEHEEVIRHHTPSLTTERTFPILVSSAIPPRANFKAGRVQSTSHSVFTSVLLPLAATYYRRIHLVGFDGKDPSVKNYFWKHSDEFQFNDLLPSVRESDPGFFAKRDYDDYSRRNSDEIEHFLGLVESSGVEVRMTHPSFIEPLQRRFQRAK